MKSGIRWHGVTVVLVGVLVILASRSLPADEAKLKVLLIDGRNNHEWEKTTPELKNQLEATGRFVVDVHTAPPPVEGKPDKWPIRLTADEMKPYDCILSNYNGPDWAPETKKALEEYVRGGKGFALVHSANNCHRSWKEYDKMLGYNWRGGSAHGPKFEYDVNITDVRHPITAGLGDFWHNEPDRLPELFAKDPDAMSRFAQQNAESIRKLIRELRIPKVKWQIDADRAVWALPEHTPADRWWRIQCVKQGPEWKIDKIE